MLSTPYKGASKGSITQGFKLGVHPALDMVLYTEKSGYGTPLCAPEDCVILQIRGDKHTPNDYAPFKNGYGIWLKGLETGMTHLYWHTMPVFPVNLNKNVPRGQIVAYMGNSGYTVSGGIKVSTEDALSSFKGTHLHWETYPSDWKLGSKKEFVDISTNIDWSSRPTYTKVDHLKSIAVVLGKISNLIK